jgi:L-lactate dehydrogenase (cytochrome)
VTPEQLAAAGGDADRWFQLYLWKDRGATKDLVARAAASG